MNPSICAGSKPPYGWATYSTGTPRSGKMSRDMRSSARNPANAAATTIVKSEIGRRNANDTRFIGCRARTAPKELHTHDFRPYAQPSGSNDLRRRAELGRRTVLGWPGVCLAPTTEDMAFRDRRAMGQTVADSLRAELCLHARTFGRGIRS